MEKSSNKFSEMELELVLDEGKTIEEKIQQLKIKKQDILNNIHQNSTNGDDEKTENNNQRYQ